MENNKKNLSTLEYLIIVQRLLNVHNGKTSFMWLASNTIKCCWIDFSIYLNAQHVNGMTPGKFGTFYRKETWLCNRNLFILSFNWNTSKYICLNGVMERQFIVAFQSTFFSHIMAFQFSLASFLTFFHCHLSLDMVFFSLLLIKSSKWSKRVSFRGKPQKALLSYLMRPFYNVFTAILLQSDGTQPYIVPKFLFCRLSKQFLLVSWGSNLGVKHNMSKLNSFKS